MMMIDDGNDGFKFKSENLCPWDPHWDFLQVQKRYTNIRRTYEHTKTNFFLFSRLFEGVTNKEGINNHSLIASHFVMIVLLTKLANLAGIVSFVQSTTQKLKTQSRQVLTPSSSNVIAAVHHPSTLPFITIGITSSIGFILLQYFHRKKSFHESWNAYKDGVFQIMRHVKRKLKFELNSINVNGPTLLMLYSITKLKAIDNAIVLPILYWLCKPAKQDIEKENDDIDSSSSNSEHDPNKHIGMHREKSDDTSAKTDKRENVTQEDKHTPLIVSNIPIHLEQSRDRSNSILTQNSELSSATQSMTTGNPPKASHVRYLEMLVHNVSHSDIVFSLGIPEALQSHYCHHPRQHPPDNASSSSSAAAETPRMKNQFSNAHMMERKEEAHALCRPRFSAFDMFCVRILNVLKSSKTQDDVRRLYSSIMSFPRYDRSDDTSIRSLVTPKPCRQIMLPVGFNLGHLVEDSCNNRELQKSLSLSSDDLASLRIRGKDVCKFDHLQEAGYDVHTPVTSSTEMSLHRNGDVFDSSRSAERPNECTIVNPLHLEAVFFPLLSSLLRRWHEQMKDKFGTLSQRNVKKVLILVTGVGTPRNFTHSISGNSTAACAELMEMFIHTLYPDVTVVRLHSEREIFRYDSNIVFANKELLPCVDAYRDAHARGELYPDEISDNASCTTVHSPFDPDWNKTFSVTLSFADGAPARTHAIQTCLRPYKPSYFHFWQLKTFWDESKICDDDIEIHSFESMETVPAMEVSRTNAKVQMVVNEMKKFRNFFIENLQNKDSDIFKFWLRKTKKPVLAVLLIDIPGEGLMLYRGTNMEVSMPTGSLCAERNVIGTALATHPNLRREDLLMVAVLAVPLPDDSNESTSGQVPSPPPGRTTTCRFIDDEIKQQSGEKESLFSQVEDKLYRYQRPENIRRSMSLGSFASIIEGQDHDSDDSWVVPSAQNMIVRIESPNGKGLEEAINATREMQNHDFPTQEALDLYQTLTPLGTPVRKIKLSNVDMDGPVSTKKTPSALRKKKTVLVHCPSDINPLKPCGACNEWLKKIAESNPYFKVVTFTDADCNGVYVKPCQE